MQLDAVQLVAMAAPPASGCLPEPAKVDVSDVLEPASLEHARVHRQLVLHLDGVHLPHAQPKPHHVHVSSAILCARQSVGVAEERTNGELHPRPIDLQMAFMRKNVAAYGQTLKSHAATLISAFHMGYGMLVVLGEQCTTKSVNITSWTNGLSSEGGL